MRILIVGFTTRAAAESARRAEHDIVTVDYFGDLDQKALCENYSLRELGRPYSASALLALARALSYDGVAYAGGLENHPEVVRRLSSERTLLGNEPATLRRARDPETLFSFLRSHGFAAPRIHRCGDSLPHAGAWLRKPLRSGGGREIRSWGGERLRPGEILQEFVEGTPASAAFVADGRRSLLLGWTEQLSAPGGFGYGGNILPCSGPPAARAEVEAMAEALTSGFGLRGLNGLDFILQDDRAIPLEVNPRYSASMELFDRAAGISTFGLHVAACQGRFPPAIRIKPGFWGKRIVYAPIRLRLGDTDPWLDRGVRDIPHPGEVIGRGDPICTVFAWAPTREACLEGLSLESQSILESCTLALSVEAASSVRRDGCPLTQVAESCP